MAGDVDLVTLVKQQYAASPSLEHERERPELEQRVRVARGGFDLLFVADHDVRIAGRLAGELAVLLGALPERRAPVEVEDRRTGVRRERGQRRLAARRLGQTRAPRPQEGRRRPPPGGEGFGRGLPGPRGRGAGGGGRGTIGR